MPLLTGRIQVAMKAEAAAGTAETLESGTGLAANAEMILASEASWDPDVAQVERAAAGQSFDTAGSVAGVRQAKMTFKANLRGRTSAFSASVLPDINLALKACGCTVTFSGGAGSEIVTVAPVSSGSGINTTFYTVGIYNDGILYRLAGAEGNFKLNFKSGELVTAEFEMSGAYVAPSDVAMRTTSLSGSAPAPPPFLGAAASVLGLATPRFDTMTFDLGNAVIYRGDPNATSGILTALITGRKTNGTLDPEGTLVATKNYWSEFLADTTGSLTTGTFPSTGTQYNKINLTMPKAKYRKVSLGDRNGLRIFPIEYEAQRNTDTGDDSWSLVFS
jgi:hypothetical protein